MTIEESENVVWLNQKIKLMRSIPDKISKLQKEEKYDDIIFIAMEFSCELAKKYEDELLKYPSKIK